MILDLPLPPGWARAQAPGTAYGEGGDFIWPADAPSPTSATGPTSLRSMDNLALQPAVLLVSPFLPLPTSLPALIEQALTSESDYQLSRRSAMLTPRLGPWEAVQLLTQGTSRETGIETGRIYAALDAGYGAFLLIFIDGEPRRLPERQRQLDSLLAQAQLRPGPAAGSEAPDEAAIPPQRPPGELFFKEVLYRHLID